MGTYPALPRLRRVQNWKTFVLTSCTCPSDCQFSDDRCHSMVASTSRRCAMHAGTGPSDHRTLIEADLARAFASELVVWSFGHMELMVMQMQLIIHIILK